MGSLRSIVIPDDPENDVLLTTDYAQVEVWCYAKQTNCRWLLDIYEKGEYLYGPFYELFYKLPFFKEGLPRTKKNKRADVSEKFIRRVKAIPLGFLYNRTAAAIAEEHAMPVAEVEGYRRDFFRKCPELQDSYSRDVFQMQQKGWVRYP
jgi:DNA polymerase I-like protein with 3'-5' exonuclease and polymerase domains